MWESNTDSRAILIQIHKIKQLPVHLTDQRTLTSLPINMTRTGFETIDRAFVSNIPAITCTPM